MTMTLTVEALIRALRGRAHGLADQVEAGYRPAERPRGRPAQPKRASRQARRTNRDDFAGR